jgi:predicted PurR-regulated permease PerM
MTERRPFARGASYALAAAALFVTVKCGLAPALIAGLAALMLLTQSERHMRAAGAGTLLARTGALALFTVLASLLLGILISFGRLGLARLPVLLDRLLPRLDELAGQLGVVLPVENAGEFKGYVVGVARANARLLTTEGGLLTRGFFQIVVAVAAAVLAYLTPRSAAAGPRELDAAVRAELSERAARFTASFELVMGAQIVIAAINTGVTAIFLFALPIPFRTVLLLATFFFGLIPLAGNIASNAMVVAAAFTVSDGLALTALVFLVVSHKAQYFLNGRLVGRRIDTPTWGILLGLLVGEALMGLPGAILAPTLIHYAREELRARPES